MNGVGEGRFGLGETISREQFVTILVRMFGWESVSCLLYTSRCV